MYANPLTTEDTMNAQLAHYEELDRQQAAYLAAHPKSPRYCYDCQQWLSNASELPGHPGHAIH